MGDIGRDSARHHHHHLICLGCGEVTSFQDDLLEELEGKIRETANFKIVDHEVKLYGYCERCGGRTD
jgi:Fur family ferric uptake transcriptional regulator